MTQPKHILVLYSGGLDTSVMVHWLKNEYNAKITCFTANVGQQDDFSNMHEKAMATGASDCHVVDLKDDFVKNYVFTLIKSQAEYENNYLMGTALARPCIAKAAVELAQKLNCDAIAHGATGKGNDQIRFEIAIQTLAPKIKILAPWRIWPYESRQDLIDYASLHNIPITASAEKPFSIDENIMHTSYEGGVLENILKKAPNDLYQQVNHPNDCPKAADKVIIDFNKGIPVAINGQTLAPVECLKICNEIAGKHGIGHIDIIENRFIGIKSRGVYEQPGTALLQKAHAYLGQITLDKQLARILSQLKPQIADLIYNGFWFSPEFIAYKTLIDHINLNLTGQVTVSCQFGHITPVAIQAEQSFYSDELASFDSSNNFSHADAEGFIKLQSLRLQQQSKTIKQNMHLLEND